MGCGKSAVGPMVARGVGFEFVDTDDLVVANAERKIPEIFAEEGEAGFRTWETEALEQAASRGDRVIATGGGIVTVEKNFRVLDHSGFVVWLDADEEVLWKRIDRSRDRPMLYTEKPRKTMHALLTARAPLYKKAADMRIDSTELSADDVAYGVAESARVFFSI